MHLSVYRQCEISYYAFVFGVFMGVYYDLFRFIRILGFKSKKSVIAQDIIFMSTLSIFVSLFAQVTVNGKLRFFVLMFHFFGIISYRYSFGIVSGVFMNYFAVIVKLLKKLLLRITTRIFKLFGIPYSLLIVSLKKVAKKCHKMKEITLSPLVR